MPVKHLPRFGCSLLALTLIFGLAAHTAFAEEATRDGGHGEKSIQPMRMNSNPKKLHKASNRPTSPPEVSERAPSVPGGGDRVVHNAIGMPIASHQLFHDGAGPIHGVGPGTARPIIAAPPKPAVVNHGIIDGARLTRSGSGTSMIGGPVKRVANINGTTMKPKH